MFQGLPHTTDDVCKSSLRKHRLWKRQYWRKGPFPTPEFLASRCRLCIFRAFSWLLDKDIWGDLPSPGAPCDVLLASEKKGPVTCTPTDLRYHPGAKARVDALKDPAERRDLPDAALVRGEAEARPRHILFLEHVVVPHEAFLSLAVRQLGRSGPQLRGLHEHFYETTTQIFANLAIVF